MTELCSLRTELTLACQGRDLSPAATEELRRLIFDGTVDEIRDVLEHLRATPPVRTGEVDVCADTTARFDELWVGAVARQEAHRQRIERAARRFAAEVADYDNPRTLSDAQKRLERICDERDDAVADQFPCDEQGKPIAGVRLVPWNEAVDLAESTFAEALAAAERQRAGRWAA